MLAQRLRLKLLGNPLKKAFSGCGTVFFWGMNDSGKRIPLDLEADASNHERLRGVDDRGNAWQMPFTPDSIIQGLHEKKLLPSLFTCFLVVSFARGLSCVGGYFQCEYLPAMQRGVVKALQKIAGYEDLARRVAQVPTDVYLSGMLAVMTRIKTGCLAPAGPAEIIAGGGLTRNDIEQMLALTVGDAHLAALFETVPDMACAGLNPHDWKKQLAADCALLLEGKVVVK